MTVRKLTKFLLTLTLPASLVACGGPGIQPADVPNDDPPSAASWHVDFDPEAAVEKTPDIGLLLAAKPYEDGTELAYPDVSGELGSGFSLVRGQVREIQFERIHGELVFEGDIILDESEVFETPTLAAQHFEVSLYDDKDEIDRGDDKSTARSKSKYRWSNKTVYYRVASNLTNKQRAYDAMAYWRENAGLRFEYRTSQSNYIRFINGSGCSSKVGKQGGKQNIKLSSGCSMGSTIHEIGHAVGLWHEQSRTDRGGTVTINWSNIESGKSHNFKTYTARGEDGVNIGAYDIGSIMHYGSFAFSKNGNATITRTNGTTFSSQRSQLTVGDRAGVRYMYGLGNDARWHGWFAPNAEVPRTGDFNRDGITDAVTFVRGSSNRRVWVSLSNGQGFNTSTVWKSSFCNPGEVCEVGDFNGDGRDDLISFVRNSQSGRLSGDVRVALSTGSGFGASQTWHSSFCYGAEVCKVGDFNGDGRDDIAAFIRSSKSGAAAGDVWVALSSGTGFGTSRVWHASFCYGSEVCEIGDINGDGRDDIYAFVRSSRSGAAKGDVWVARSYGSGFGSSYAPHGWFCLDYETCKVDDVNGDGRDDLIAFVRTNGASSTWGDVWVSYSTGTSYGSSRKMHTEFCRSGSCQTGDVTGDGLTDFIQFTQGSSADIYIAR